MDPCEVKNCINRRKINVYGKVVDVGDVYEVYIDFDTEIGWAKVHPILEKYGWKYVNSHIWDKGISNVAGNSNTKTLRKFPVVTEVCVQYVKEAGFEVNGQKLNARMVKYIVPK